MGLDPCTQRRGAVICPCSRKLVERKGGGRRGRKKGKKKKERRERRKKRWE